MTLVFNAIASVGIAAFAIEQFLPLSKAQASFRHASKTSDRVLPVNIAQSISNNDEVSVPLSADYFYQRGLAYSKQEFYHEVILNFTEAIRLKPNFTNAYYQQGIAHFLEPPPAVERSLVIASSLQLLST